MRQINILLLSFFAISTFAAAPSNYYNSAEGKSERALKTALSYIIDDHDDNGYGGLYYIYEDSDDKNGKVWDMYSNCNWYHGSKKCGDYQNYCDCYNREHTIPQSWFNENYPMRSDAHHVIPTDGKVNGVRSNYPHGETNASALGGSALGKKGTSSVSGYSGAVYEPDDQYKGDIARMYFYFVTRYQSNMSSFNGAAFQKNTYPSLQTWFLNTMLKWHREDPVSPKELDRNDGVYKHQRNRNPFIDYPALVEHIWGNKKSVAWYKNATSTDDILENKFQIQQNPVKDHIILEGNSTMEFTFQIYSITGQMQQSGNSTVGEQINISELNNGAYILRVKSDEYSQTLKFIVAK